MTQALALQRRFVADASHELRTPLTIVHTRAQLLRSRLRVEDHVGATDPDQLVADTRALGEVVEDLLLSAELDARPSAGVDVDVGRLAQEVVASFSLLAAERSIALTAELGQDACTVRGVPAALRRALGALVDNALGHVSDGGKVRVTVSPAGDQVTLAVIDDGSGLDAADANRLLQRFARGTGDGTGRRFGLGLALVHEVVVAHGGTLTLRGSPASAPRCR